MRISIKVLHSQALPCCFLMFFVWLDSTGNRKPDVSDEFVLPSLASRQNFQETKLVQCLNAFKKGGTHMGLVRKAL